MMGVWDDVLEPSVLRPRSSYGVRALVVDVASDLPQKEKNEHPCQKRTGVKEGKRKRENPPCREPGLLRFKYVPAHQ